MKIRKFSEVISQSYHSMTAAAFCAVALIGVTTALRAQPISVPNYSFESQSGVGYPFGTNPNVDNWQKIGEPAYFQFVSGGQIPWYGTAGVFVDSTPYGNRLGTQA